jgi:hypothetical protein
MPRAKLPLLVSPPRVADTFHLDETAKKCICKTLSSRRLQDSTVEAIEVAVNCHRAIASGSASTTVANTVLALRNFERLGRPRQVSLALLADDRAGVDYTTHNALGPLVKSVSDGHTGQNDVLAKAVLKRAAELAVHPRVTTSMEPLRLFCGVLRVIFNGCTAHLKDRISPKEAWRRCRRFAIEIFTAADIAHADFDAHPERLTEYLQTDVSAD